MAILEQLKEAFRAYSAIDLEAAGNKSAVIVAFINQATPDIKKKLPKIDGLAGKSLSELLEVVAKVYNKRETSEERWARLRIEANEQGNRMKAAENDKQRHAMAIAEDRQTHDMAYLVLVAMVSDPEK